MHLIVVVFLLTPLISDILGFTILKEVHCVDFDVNLHQSFKTLLHVVPASISYVRFMNYSNGSD